MARFFPHMATLGFSAWRIKAAKTSNEVRLAEAFAEVETQLAQLKLRKLLEAQATPRERPRKAAKWLSLNIDATLAAGVLMLVGAAAATAVGPLALAGYICGVITAWIAELILAPR